MSSCRPYAEAPRPEEALLGVFKDGGVAQALSALSVRHRGLTAASLQDTREDDGVQVRLAQPLASVPVGAGPVPHPRRGEGALQADRSRQGGGAGASLPLAGLPLTLPAGDGRVAGAGVCDPAKAGRYLDRTSRAGAPMTTRDSPVAWMRSPCRHPPGWLVPGSFWECC